MNYVNLKTKNKKNNFGIYRINEFNNFYLNKIILNIRKAVLLSYLSRILVEFNYNQRYKMK